MNSPVMQPEQVLGALPPLKLFIGGTWVDSDSGEQIDVVSPSTGKVLAKIPHATAADVGRAVTSRHNRPQTRFVPDAVHNRTTIGNSTRRFARHSSRKVRMGSTRVAR